MVGAGCTEHVQSMIIMTEAVREISQDSFEAIITVESLNAETYRKCPDWRGVLISGVK